VQARELLGVRWRARIGAQAGAAGTALVQEIDFGSNDFPMKKTPVKASAAKATSLHQRKAAPAAVPSVLSPTEN
jgi:hypothetical protein